MRAQQHRALRMAMIAAACAVSASSADAASRVGVVVSLAVNVPPEEVTQLSESLGRALNDSLVLDVVAGSEAERRLPADGLPENCFVEAACISDVGTRLAADQLLFLVMVRIGERLQIDISWSDVTSGRSVSRPPIVVEAGGASLEEQVTKLATVLFPEARIREKTPVATLASTSSIAEIPPAPVAVTSAQTVTKPTQDDRNFFQRLPAPVLITASASAIALVGGSVAGIMAATRDASLRNDGCDTRACDPGRVDGLARTNLAADILFGVSAASAAVTTVLYFTLDDDADVTMAVQPTGVAVKGRF